MKKFFLIGLISVIGVSVLNNIRNQFITLNEAKKRNDEVENEIVEIRQENQILEQKIEYATNSASLEQEIRDKLALGKGNDVWLNLKPEERLDLYPKMNEVKEIPKIRQWINLFTQ